MTSSGGFQQNFRKDKKTPLTLLPDSPEYKRIKYLLKMSLRMINGSFNQFTVLQYNQSGMNFDNAHDKTVVECWVQADGIQKEEIIRNQGFEIKPNEPLKFTAGTIIDNPNQIKEDIFYTFFLVRVVIGRAFCYKGNQNYEKVQLESGYDSVYLENEANKSTFQHSYLIYNAERVQLMHMVQTKISIDPLKAYSEIGQCDSCNDLPAQYYCINDEAYFCNECWDNHHVENKFMSKHKQVPIGNEPKDFGKCPDHRKSHEYFCNCCSTAYCSECLASDIQKTEGGKSHHSYFSIEKAYSNAQSEANQEDIALAEKKKVIESQIIAVKAKMERIKVNAINEQKKLTKILEDVLKEMHDAVQKKSNVLKSDRHELVRQYQEILYVQEFLKKQSEEAQPLEFLLLNTGHAQIKDSIQKQWPKISNDLQEDKELLKITGRPHLMITDSSNQLKDTQNLNQGVQNVSEKAKGQLENFHLSQKFRGSKNYSTKFRESLFNQRGNRLAENSLFNQSQGITELQSKNPQTLQSTYDENGGLVSNTADSKGGYGRGGEYMGSKGGKQASHDSLNYVEKMFRAIEKKLQMPEFNGIVQESLKFSCFGEFGKNFRIYQEQHAKDEKKDNFLRFFQDSEILTDEHQIYKALLYFNLPYEKIIKDGVTPNRIFDYKIEDQEDKNVNLGGLIEKFEHISGNKSGGAAHKTLPSIILMKIDLGTDADGQEQSNIIGGYASHGWLVSGGMKQGSGSGDKSCFLFNLTQNLRFSAREGMSYYQQASDDAISFGNTDLILKDDFQTVTSHITPPELYGKGGATGGGLGGDSGHLNSVLKDKSGGLAGSKGQAGSHFCFGNDLTQNIRVLSIIPNEHIFKPTKLEVWVLGDTQ